VPTFKDIPSNQVIGIYLAHGEPTGIDEQGVPFDVVDIIPWIKNTAVILKIRQHRAPQMEKAFPPVRCCRPKGSPILDGTGINV
jgi:hypothetical protein